MMRIRLLPGIVLLTFFIGLISCDSDQKETDSETKEIPKPASPQKIKTEIPESGSVTGDTINLNGQFVLFYGPEEKSKDETLVKYMETITVIMDSLKIAGNLPFAYTTVSNMRIYNRDGSAMIISRSGFNENKGVLIMDGLQPPTIKKGMLTLPEYHQLIKKYFLRP